MALSSNNCLLWFLLSLFLLNLFLVESSSYEQEELSWLDDKDDEEVNMIQSRHSSLKRCDFSTGKWVYDQSYPLYDSSCPYLTTAVTCKKNGRPDSDYEKWRWKPNGCNLPRYFTLLQQYVCNSWSHHIYIYIHHITINFVIADLMHWNFWEGWEGRG